MINTEKKITVVFILGPIVTLILALLLYNYQKNIMLLKVRELESSTSYLFWTMDNDGIATSFNQTAKLSNYERISLSHIDGELYFEVINKDYSNRSLFRELIYPIKIIKVPVTWEETQIGFLEVHAIDHFVNTLIVEIIIILLISFLLVLTTISQDRSNTLQITMDRLIEVQGELIESNKQASLGKLVRGLAHEINTPLGNAIMMNSYILEEIDHNKGDGKIIYSTLSESYKLVQKSLNRILEIISRFKEIESAINDPVVKLYSLKSVIDEVILSNMSIKEGLIKNVTKSINGDAKVKASKSELLSIFGELVSNSFAHCNTEEDTEIIIDITILPRDEFIEIKYSDNGPEVSREIHNTMFEPFVSGKKFGPTLGMGLHIVSYLLQTSFMGKVSYSRDEDRNIFSLTMKNSRVGVKM